MKTSILTSVLSAGDLAAGRLPKRKRSEYFSDWPQGAAPAEVGKRVAENFLTRKFRYETDPDKAAQGVIYPEVIAWYGSLTLAQLTKDQSLTDRLVKKFELYLSEPGSKNINPAAHVDYRVFGVLPLEIYIQNKDTALQEPGPGAGRRPVGEDHARRHHRRGALLDRRHVHDPRCFRCRRSAPAGTRKYLDRAALTMCAYFDRMQESNGLFFHGEKAHFFWGRGNGWMAAGSAELLRSLPESHPQRERILAGYRKMMDGLLATQAEDGMWRQLIDKPESWPETSGTAMFTFAMVTGVKNGWLEEKTYGPAARKAWLALVGLLDENANLREVCVGTNKGVDEAFYLARPRTAGDLHGQAPMLWTASALLR